jgi:NADH-quinone oxidoreductase subunit C
VPVVDRLSEEQALERARDALGGFADAVELNHGHLDIACPPANVVEVITRLRDTDGLACRFFTFLSAVDRTELKTGEEDQTGGLEVLVHVYSPEHAVHASVHVPVDVAAPVCPTLTGVFRGAEWHERECHEMFGVHFEGHPNLSNLYLSEDFEGHPGLKSFKLPSRALVKDWPGAKDPDEAAAGGR